ncbi:hypothetical protein BN946_scf184971.g11 [Trametes cinnabarina]|uniref:Uncharacterized protein n=1 Tax=Pycnoporus cinnabarinus TaxID=5643 RepID=A0A060SUY6_PYCCI|nr:hypothetical protein BN946_scf184971.g11 [Trametes cinnabarina]
MSAAKTATYTTPETTEFTILLENSLKHGEDFDAISDKFEEEFNKPEVQEQAIKDIRDLTKNVREIRQMFSKIGLGFVEFDNANFLDKDNKVLKLGPQWREYQDRFQKILDMSFDNASAASAFMQIYSKAILTDVEADQRAALREELEGFVKKLEVKASDALNTKNEFTRLAEDIRVFAAVMEETLKRASGRLTQDMDIVKAKLESLRSQLQEVHARMKSMGIACVASLAVGAIAAGIAIVTLSPVAMFIAVSSVFSAIGTGIKVAQAKKEAAQLEADIKKYEAELAELVAREKLLAKYQASLESTKKDITGLAAKVDAIAGIWQSLKGDMVSLHAQLSLSTDPDMPLTSRFMKKIKATRELYMRLATLLDMYAKGQEAPEDHE